MKLKCKCGLHAQPLLKLGGLICPGCRVILKLPSDPEYAEFKKLLKSKQN